MDNQPTNSKWKLLLASVVAVASIAATIAMGYHYFGPPAPFPKATMVSVADLVRLEKNNPNALTADQRRILAAIPDSEKQQLMTKQSFSLSAARSQKP